MHGPCTRLKLSQTVTVTVTALNVDCDDQKLATSKPSLKKWAKKMEWNKLVVVGSRRLSIMLPTYCRHISNWFHAKSIELLARWINNLFLYFCGETNIHKGEGKKILTQMYIITPLKSHNNLVLMRNFHVIPLFYSRLTDTYYFFLIHDMYYS